MVLDHKEEPLLKRLSYIALVAMGLLVVGGFIYYKERTLFADAAYVLFNIINYDSFNIQFNRYGAFVTQLVAYLGQKAHLPIRVILISYSASFSLFYLIILWVIVKRYKEYALGILMSFFYFVFVSASYYWASEIPLGIAWMFLMFGMSMHMAKKGRNILLMIVPFAILAFLTLFTHFAIMIATIYLWVYLLLERRQWPLKARDTIILSVILVAIIVIKFTLAMNGPKDAGDGPILGWVAKLSFSDIGDALKTPVVTVFFERCLSNYWAGCIIFLLGVGNLFRTKKWLLATWAILSVFGYICIMGLTFGNRDGHMYLFHIESEWHCMTILVCAPFVFGLLPYINPKFAVGFVSVLFIVRMGYIIDNRPPFHWHYKFQEKVIAQMKKKGITKLALYRDWDVKPKYILDWATQMESMLASSMNSDQPMRTFSFIDDIDSATIKSMSPKSFNTGFGMTRDFPLNYKYFAMDTVQPYVIMSYKELFK